MAKRLLINVSYIDNTNKFWFESLLKNKIVTLEDGKNIHELIKELCEDDGMKLSYKGKPKGNMFVDGKDGSTKKIGYLYRGKSEIYDRTMSIPQIVLFDVWVSIFAVSDFEIEEIN